MDMKCLSVYPILTKRKRIDDVTLKAQLHAILYEPHHVKTCLGGGGFGEVEGLYYLCSENKGANHRRAGLRADNQRLCFIIYGRSFYDAALI